MLTPREKEVLCLAEYSNLEIARLLHIELQTVKNYWTEVYRKLNMDGQKPKRTYALTSALRKGIVTMSEVKDARRDRI